jgi:Derlin-2/3
MIFTSALVLAFAYTSTQDDRGQQATFFVITIPAQWIPYAMLLMALVMGGSNAAMVQGTGLIAAHLHDFLTRLWPMFGGGKNLLPTPALFKKWFFVRERRTGYGTSQAARGQSSSTSTATEGSSSGVLPESWRNRGSGHRLGGD